MLNGPYSLSGSPAEDALANSIATIFANALNTSVIGKKGTAERTDRTDFYSDVLSLTGQKFIASPAGKDTVQKVTLLGLGGGAVVGLLLGYVLFKKG
jgi:hypothetical protein